MVEREKRTKTDQRGISLLQIGSPMIQGANYPPLNRSALITHVDKRPLLLLSCALQHPLNNNCQLVSHHLLVIQVWVERDH